MKRKLFSCARMALPAAALLMASAAPDAGATTISGDLTADNGFLAFISMSNTTLGTEIASGNSWSSTYSFSDVALTAGQTYYLQIEAVNQGGPGAFLGQFTLSDSGFQFSNGTQTLLTDTSDWQAIYNDTNTAITQQPWVTPNGSVISDGLNGVSPWGAHSAISSDAEWIDATTEGLGACGTCTVDFSTPITPTSVTPEPASFLMLAGALAAAAAFRMRRAAYARVRP